MKLKWILLLPFAALLPGLLLAQDKPKKSKQKIVIIKKSVDENGNKVVEKIVREGEGDEKMEWEDGNGHVIIKLGDGDVEWKSLEGDDIDIDIDLEGMNMALEQHLEGMEEQLRNIDVELEELDGMKNLKVIIEPDGEVIEWKGMGDLPKALQERLESKGLHFESLDGDNFEADRPALELEAFEAFPNPADNQLTVRFTGAPAPVTILLFDAAGQQVYKEYIKDFGGQYDQQIGLQGLPEGLFLLTIEQEGRVFNEKLMIARQ